MAASLLLTQPVEWRDDWKRFRTTEYAATATMLGIDVAILLSMPETEARTRGGVLFDERTRGWLVGGDATTRYRAQQWSDRLYFGMYAWGAVGAPLAAWAHGRADVAGQMLLMNAEAFALTGLVQGVLSNVVGRQRPFTSHCAPGDAGFPCNEGGRAQSFISGHAAMAATAAGLNCAHHQHLPLWGRGADTVACASGVVAATAVGLLRVVADKHWTTDTLLGLGLGFGVGYGLPSLLHYRSAPSVLVLPRVDAASAGLALSGMW